MAITAVAQKIKAKLDNTYALPPRALSITITERCNANCIMCEAPKGKQDMFLRLYTRLIDEVAQWKPAIYINAMEPLLHPQIGEIVRYTKSKGVKVVLTTNGLLLESLVPELLPLDFLWVSIDGVDKLHDRVRRVPKAYDKASKGIEKAVEAGIPVGISSCINEVNYGNLAETAQAMQKLGVERILFGHLNYFDNKPKDIDAKILQKQVVQAYKSSSSVEFLPMLWSVRDIETWYKEPSKILTDKKCTVAWSGMRIDCNGDALIAFRCFAKPMGNVFDSGLMKVWNSKKYRQFRKSISTLGTVPDCNRCCILYD